MPQTPDRFPGVREDEGILLESDAIHPAVDGEIRYVAGLGFRFFEEGVDKPLCCGDEEDAITQAEHAAIRQLIHFIDQGPAEEFATGAYLETLPSADPFPTSFIWWTSSAKTEKIVEETITYNGNKTVNTDVWVIYDVDGSTPLAGISDSITYSGVFELNRTRTISVYVSPGTTPVTETTHPALRQLIHFIDEGPAEGFTSLAYRETLPSADPFPTSIIWWTSSAKTSKIVEETISYNANKTVNTDAWYMYATDGVTILKTVVDTYSYSGVFETSRTRAIT